MILSYIIVFTLVGSVLSLIGGIFLLSNKTLSYKISHFLTAFAAGALLGTAFFDLLPEASETGNEQVLIWTLFGILLFFILERLIHWFHTHQAKEKEAKKGIVPLIVIGDSIHNFIDGVVIAGTFLVSIPLGIVTALAVAAHEVPQEIGDFGVLLHTGMKRGKVLLINFFSACTAVAGALITFFAADSIDGYLPVFLSLTAGFFIYIALSDLVPEIHSQESRHIALIESILLLSGVAVIYIFVRVFEG